MRAQFFPTMRNALVLFFLLIRTPGWGGPPPPPELVQRSLVLSTGPGAEVPEVYVAGQVATVLRFEKRCDPVRTKLAPGWGSRFEPLMVSRGTVVLVPIQDITPEDRLLLLVAFEDGSEMPFTVTARNDQIDQQVNLIQNPDSQQAVRWLLADTRREKWKLGLENERHRQEALSPDHALAGLLVTGAEGETTFIEAGGGSFKDGPIDATYRLFKSRRKAGVVLKIRNQGPLSWKLEDALLAGTSGEHRSFALRTDRDEIAPGTSGTLAIVVDRSAFLLGKRPVELNVKLFVRARSPRVYLVLKPELAGTVGARTKL